MKQILTYFNTGQFWSNLKSSFLLRENMQIIISILIFITFIYIVISILYKVISLLAKGGVKELKNHIEQFSFKSLTSALNFLTILIMLLSVSLAYESIENTLNISTNQLEQSEKLYELQNRPILSIKEVKWYPVKVRSGDTGFNIDVYLENYGKSPASEARIIKDIVLRIETDTVTRFPNFIKDVTTVSEVVDVDKDKRLYEEYRPYRSKPYYDISEYILGKKGDVTGDDIIRYFSEERGYSQQGYSFIRYSDLTHQSFFTIHIGSWEFNTGRSVSVEGFEEDFIKQGGDLLLFYFAIEYKGPLKVKKYTIHHIACYDSYKSKKADEQGRYLFPYQGYFEEESDI